MSEPITDTEILNRTHAVDGATWMRVRSVEDHGNVTLCLRGPDWQIWVGEDGWTDMDGTPPDEAFVAWGCARMGQPTPQALARTVLEWGPERSQWEDEPVCNLLDRLASIGGES